MGIRSWFLSLLPARKMTSEELWLELYGAASSATGKTVNHKTALQVTTAIACGRVVSEGVAQVPFKLYQEGADGRSRLPAKDHPLYEILSLRPNGFQTSFEYRETMALHLVLCGAHFSVINRGATGRKILELLPLEPQHVTVQRARDGTLTYKWQPEEGPSQTFRANEIWHVRGPSWNGYLGLEAVKLARDAIGLAMATEESQAKMHANGARAGGLLSVEGNLDDKKYDQLRAWLAKHYEGSHNAHRTMILDRAAKFTSTQQTGVDSQHLETRRFQIEEICRALRVMPIMVGHSDKATTYASAEQMFLAHVVHTLAPWYQRIEQSVSVNLLTPAERQQGYYAKFTEEGLLRGAMKDTKDTILGYVNGGVLTVNEGRALLDRNPDPDPASDKMRIPANITGSVPVEKASPPTDKPEDSSEE